MMYNMMMYDQFSTNEIVIHGNKFSNFTYCEHKILRLEYVEHRKATGLLMRMKWQLHSLISDMLYSSVMKRRPNT